MVSLAALAEEVARRLHASGVRARDVTPAQIMATAREVERARTERRS